MLQTTESMFKMNTKLRKGRFSLGNRFVNHRGGLISHIDDALHSYDKLRRRPVAPDVEGPALAAIIVACAKWLKAKRTKGKTGENFAARKACIDLLARDTYTRLQAINRVTQVSQFAYRKAIPQTRAPRSLHGGYAYERLMYLKQGKAYNPAAAGELKYQLEQIQGGLSSSKILSDHEKTLFNAMGAKTFGMLSYQDYLVLDKLATKSSLGGRKGVEVTFFSKASRMPYLVLYPDANGFLERAPATPLNTTAEPGGFMYAIDEYGNLFAKNSRALNGVGYFNHSSFNAGKDILCAGMLETLNTGELVMISNQSGHYTPPRQNLWDAVDYLVTEGVNTTNTMVQLYEKSTTGFANGVDQAGMAQQMVPGIYRHDFTVAQFHANYLLRAPAPILRHRA